MTGPIARPPHPFDPERRMGTVAFVGPSAVRVNLPRAADSSAREHYGTVVPAGEVGEFVVIECGPVGVFGRLIEVRLPERERLAVEPEMGTHAEAHPVGSVQLLSTLDLESWEVTAGVTRFPRLGSHVYSAHPEVMRWIVETSERGRKGKAEVALDFATLPAASGVALSLTPERLFGRHCAVLGATGGGKSWTVARLVEGAANFESKTILFDASGEFHKLSDGVMHVYLGEDDAAPKDWHEVVFPHGELFEADLFAVFTPSMQSQGPRLRAAIKSLRLLVLEPALSASGVLVKADKERKPCEDAVRKHATALEEPRGDFAIERLGAQVIEECVYPDNFGGTKFGKYDEKERGYCTGLVVRIDGLVSSPHLKPLFRTQGKRAITTIIDEFLDDPDKRVLRISLKHLSFAHCAREIVANAIGRHLLDQARGGKFLQKPLVVFLDEAHQFLNKSLGDENTKHALDAFGLIAKEGRKYGLTICIATQRPRDIPEDVLSQMGTLIVHRLINDRDREVVERASGEIDRSAAAFLPTLGPGEAIIIGVDFAMPLQVKVTEPENTPDSSGPNYQAHWARKKSQPRS